MKLSVIDKKVCEHSDGVDVYLTCSTNLKWFEQQFTHFDPKMIRNTVRKYLDTITKTTIDHADNSFHIVIPQPHIPQAQIKEYEYTDVFVVYGSAKKSAEDESDYRFGQMLAESRAKTAAYSLMKSICDEILHKYLNMTTELEDCSKHMSYMLHYEKEHRNDLMTNKYGAKTEE